MHVYSARLPAGGSTWSANFVVTSNTTAHKESPAIAIGPTGMAYSVWSDQRSGNEDVWFASLPSGGTTWSTNEKVSDDPGAGHQEEGDVGVDGAGNLIVVWHDERTSPHQVRARHRTGSTWASSVVVAATGGRTPSLSTRADGNAYVAWHDGAVASQETVSGSEFDLDAGIWSAPELVSDTGAGSGRASVAFTQSLVVVLWDTAGQAGIDIRARIRSSAPSISWSTSSIHITVTRGTSSHERLTLTANEDIDNASVAVDSSILGLVAPAALPPFDLTAGVTYEVPMIFDVPLTTTVGEHVGAVSILSAGDDPIGAVTVAIQVVDPPSGVIPQDVATPSRDRIGTDSAGNTMIVDELLVGLEFGTVDPSQRILAIAAANDARVLGSVPDALTYQLWFLQVPSAVELESIRQSLVAEADVGFASITYLGTDLTAIPNDPEWNHAWDEANPDGRNWNLELIKAPSAWDITTGDRDVPIAVIDADINPDHEDLSANVDKHEGIPIPQPEKEGHGTHVSGIACAAGNNGVGITGVAWECSLRAYEFGFDVLVDPTNPPTWEDFFTPAQGLDRMVEAAKDGARVVNMSWGQAFGECALGLLDPDPLPKLEMTNDIFARGVLFAEHIGQDVLWVAGAGNRPCDANLFSPASLTSQFPLSVISVASANRTGGLSRFSGRGPSVTVAAPGGEENLLQEPILQVFSTLSQNHCKFLWAFDCSPYGESWGTSQATPHVTGLASLVLSAHDFSAAQVKACIVAGAESDGIAIDGQAFHVINAPSAVQCEGTIAFPSKVDLVFSLDLTGSMGGEVNQIKLQIDEVMAGLRDAAPETDFQFAVVSYEDYAGTFNSSGCGDSTYSATYGFASAGDVPFRLNQALSSNDATTSATIGGLQLRNGGDGPQSYGRVYWELGQPDTMSQLGFRSDALKLLVDFGDNIPHDADLNEGIEDPLVPPFPSPFDRGYDPGRNGVINCGGDDIDFQDDAIAALTSAGVHLVHIDSSGDTDLAVYWNLWASQTGGEFAAINPDGSVPQGLDLTELIVQLLQLVA